MRLPRASNNLSIFLNGVAISNRAVAVTQPWATNTFLVRHPYHKHPYHTTTILGIHYTKLTMSFWLPDAADAESYAFCAPTVHIATADLI